jgi:hypothetical protein
MIGLDPNGPRAHGAQAGGLLGVLTGLVGMWFALVVVAGALGVFAAGPTRPPLAMLLAIAGPLALFALGYRRSRPFRAFALGIDPRLLTAIQSWRVLGGVFLFLHAFGLLPGLFAWPAGLGDLAVGVAAVFVLHAMIRHAPGWPRHLWWLNVGGLLDFAVAIGTGVLTSNSALGVLAPSVPGADLGALPLSLIPTFAVPLWAIAHLISLLQLRNRAFTRGAPVSAATTP